MLGTEIFFNEKNQQNMRRPQIIPSSPSYARRVLDHVMSARKALLGILAASLVLNLLGLVAPRVTQAILDGFGQGVDPGRLAMLLLVLSGATLVQILLTVWRRLTLVHMSLDVDRKLLRELLDRLLALPAA